MRRLITVGIVLGLSAGLWECALDSGGLLEPATNRPADADSVDVDADDRTTITADENRNGVQDDASLSTDSDPDAGADDAATDEVRNDSGDATENADAPTDNASDATDATDVTNARDATDLTDVTNASDATDLTDVTNATDATDANDAAASPDVALTRDASSASDAADAASSVDSAPDAPDAGPPLVARLNIDGPNHIGVGYPGFWNASSVPGACGPNHFEALSAVHGTTDAPLFQGEAYGNPATCAIGTGLPVGTYRVRLYFGEIFWGPGCPGGGGVGSRIFDIVIEGIIVLKNFDILASSRGCLASTTSNAGVPVVKTFDVTVSDGTLDISLPATQNDGKISALEVFGPL